LIQAVLEFISVVDGLREYMVRRYIKIHFAVDVRTKEIASMNVTTDDIHDSKVLPGLMIDSSMNRLIAEAYMEHTTHQTPTPYLNECKADH
jgi:hypothetical protein